MATITTINQRVLNAINLKNQSNLYFGIGKSTAWDNEEIPDTPSTSQTEIQELIYIKKIAVKQLVKIGSPYYYYSYIYDVYGADVLIDDVSYSFVLEANAYLEQAYRVYLSTTISFNDIAPTNVNFRQIGILNNPLNSDGEELTGNEYLAANVADQGQLLYVNNFQVISKDPSQSEKIEIIITF